MLHKKSKVTQNKFGAAIEPYILIKDAVNYPLPFRSWGRFRIYDPGIYVDFGSMYIKYWRCLVQLVTLKTKIILLTSSNYL